MEFLSKQYMNGDEENNLHIPGIITSILYHSFGKKIYDRFIYNRYLKSDKKK